MRQVRASRRGRGEERARQLIRCTYWLTKEVGSKWWQVEIFNEARRDKVIPFGRRFEAVAFQIRTPLAPYCIATFITIRSRLHRREPRLRSALELAIHSFTRSIEFLHKCIRWLTRSVGRKVQRNRKSQIKSQTVGTRISKKCI